MPFGVNMVDAAANLTADCQIHDGILRTEDEELKLLDRESATRNISI